MADELLKDEIIALYAAEPDLAELPAVLFGSVARLIGADVVSYAEHHHRSREFRSLLSVDDDPQNRARAVEAFARHMLSHPFWQYDPAFYGERALRESDFFSDEEFFGLPMAKEAFLPSGAHRMMAVVMEHEGYSLLIVGHRVVGRPPFSDEERDRLQAYRPHILRSYRQAQQRTLARVKPAERLGLAFPSLTARQLEVASGLIEGRSYEEIASALGIGVDAVKAHVKAIYRTIGSSNGRVAATIAHTVLPFAVMPPLWKVGSGAWGGSAQQRSSR
ncbi:helix-turn-helix transcriptional regulator [Mesorhizobium sp. WSM4906]|uniref:helix-turn-helix transcriptional regulator n=1 Tax=Mesorhizobium sp. WSM4906 TaxID=3038546 RepID=UPI0024160422|nr:helix-turn-helix transcriptional regulator [Mesorhizobium sp. WSM4906]WFP74439.1 helix-turn-helix transcriptional regulator [Mesorhizobium sp. WSM4906]